METGTPRDEFGALRTGLLRQPPTRRRSRRNRRIPPHVRELQRAPEDMRMRIDGPLRLPASGERQRGGGRPGEEDAAGEVRSPQAIVHSASLTPPRATESTRLV